MESRVKFYLQVFDEIKGWFLESFFDVFGV